MRTRYSTNKHIVVIKKDSKAASNYNVIVNVFKKGDKLPLTGTIFNSIDKAMKWADEKIKEYEQEEKPSLKTVNKKLYDVLNELWLAHIENGGKLEYPEKDRCYISDTMDLIEIKYFGNKPDGGIQEEMAKDGNPMLTDIEAYEEMVTRLNITRL